MTAVDDRLVALPAPSGLHERMYEQMDRLLAVAESTDGMTRPDALGDLLGAFANRMQPGAKPLSRSQFVALVARVADGLGCPPAVAAPRRTRRAGR